MDTKESRKSFIADRDKTYDDSKPAITVESLESPSKDKKPNSKSKPPKPPKLDDEVKKEEPGVNTSGDKN